MNKERNRRFSAEQTKLLTTTTRTLNIVAERDSTPNHLLFVDRFNLQTRSTEDKVSDREQPSKGLTVDFNDETVTSLNHEVNCLGFSHFSEENKKVSEPMTKQPQAFFVKRSDQSPRNDIGRSVKRHRSPQESSLAKQTQLNSKPSSISGRRMSSPGKLLNIPSNKQNSASTRIVTAFERKTGRPVMHDSLHAKKKSRDGLPQITTSLETLTTEDHSKRSRSSEDVRKDGKMTSKWSPQSFCSDKSADRSQGLLESKIIPESRLTPPKPLVTEEASEILSEKLSKTKITVQSSRLDDGKAKHTSVARPADFQIDSDDLPGKTKVRENKRINDRKISLEYSRASSTASERMKWHQSQKVSMSAQMKIDHSPRRKTPFWMDGTTGTDQQDSATNPEHDLELKVKDFLRKHQPKASPRTLKVKAVKKKPAFPASKLRERRSQERITVNTDTCPSTNLVNQDRSWYYQDRRGKCRYLRVPESPTPPIEWVFQRTSSP